MRPLIFVLRSTYPLKWKGLEKFEEGRERRDFCFEVS